jgi:ATP-dependent Lon protease
MYAGKMPILALRGLAVFPDQTVHFDVGRRKSVLALEEAMRKDQNMLLIPQKDMTVDDPNLGDLYPIGTVAKVKQILRGQGETIRVLVTGICRARIKELQQNEPYLSGMVYSVPETRVTESLRTRALRREANAIYASYVDMSEQPAQAIQLRMMSSDSCGFLADSIAQNAGFDFKDKITLLAQLNPVKRLETAVRLLDQELQMLQLENDIHEKTRTNMDRQQRDYYLREQLKAIHDELGDDEASEFAAYEKKIRAIGLDETYESKLLRDVEKLRKQPFGSSEAAVLRNYLDTLLNFLGMFVPKSVWMLTLRERFWKKTILALKRSKSVFWKPLQYARWHPVCHLRFFAWLALLVSVRPPLHIPLQEA